jgi:hypothetical protein
MSNPSFEFEAWVLATVPGNRLLAEVSKVPAPLPADISRWRRLASPEAAAAAIRLADCRRRASAKFSRADRMWFNPVGLEQATAETVARHKAARFQAPIVVDLCSGIGGDAIALARQSQVLAVDLDPGMCRRVAWNAAAYGVDGQVLPCQAWAEKFAVPPGAWVHVDPDRRASKQSRARSVVDYEPGPGFLSDLARRTPAGAIKLSPASDFATHFSGSRFEVELISLNGECKEATVWFGAAAGRRRRATCLPGGATWTDRDGDPSARAPVEQVSAFVYDPDPALIRAGLLDSFAAAHQLARLKSDIDYLTSRRLFFHPLLSAFEVREVLPLDLKQLKRWVRDHDIGTLEIKTRGLDLTPEQVRFALRPTGDRATTLLLCGGAGRSLAIFARRVSEVG